MTNKTKSITAKRCMDCNKVIYYYNSSGLCQFCYRKRYYKINKKESK